MMRTRTASLFACVALLVLVGCSDPTSSGKGTELFTTWGEEFIENGIPASDGTSGFIDGWSVRYHKFLVNFHNIVVADGAGHEAARLDKPRFVDNTRAGEKELVTFGELEAQAYTLVSYEIKPAVDDEQIVSAADPADLAMMVRDGLSVYVAGEATKPDPMDAKKTLSKTFHWGLRTQTSYKDCHSDENGISTQGVVVTTNKTDTSQLTTHGDHFFYDSLQSGENAKPTAIRFEEKAQADDGEFGDGDGDITLQELCHENIDPDLYNPSGLPGSTIGDFVISLARTIGHFRGEGECTIKRIDPVPSGVLRPCDEYP
ncbi:MAG TPA: hypothetical protein VFK05_25170 [Polyangiaceae bacterium]|nr:hypothetical protein [Polyangiaceae bacterium]